MPGYWPKVKNVREIQYLLNQELVCRVAQVSLEWDLQYFTNFRDGL